MEMTMKVVNPNGETVVCSYSETVTLSSFGFSVVNYKQSPVTLKSPYLDIPQKNGYRRTQSTTTGSILKVSIVGTLATLTGLTGYTFDSLTSGLEYKFSLLKSFLRKQTNDLHITFGDSTLFMRKATFNGNSEYRIITTNVDTVYMETELEFIMNEPYLYDTTATYTTDELIESTNEELQITNTGAEVSPILIATTFPITSLSQLQNLFITPSLTGQQYKIQGVNIYRYNGNGWDTMSFSQDYGKIGGMMYFDCENCNSYVNDTTRLLENKYFDLTGRYYTLETGLNRFRIGLYKAFTLADVELTGTNVKCYFTVYYRRRYNI